MTDQSTALPPLERFAHHAMAATFEIWVETDAAATARPAAAAAFAEVDRLEQKLSRFITDSDIARINRLSGRSMVPVAQETMECLRAARLLSAETKGAFDPTVGALLDCWRPAGPPRIPSAGELAAAAQRTGMHLLELDEENLAAGLGVIGAQIDLGAIGKGYAVDRMALRLREHGIGAAVISGGGSTSYALGAPAGCNGWPLGVGYGAEEFQDAERQVVLRDRALSASGTEIQGEHILDPRTGRPPVDRCPRAWSLNPSATVADALSTAFMVLGPDDVDAVCGRFADVGALLLLEREGRRTLRRCGNWPPPGSDS